MRLDPIVEAPGTLNADGSTVPADVTIGMATFTGVNTSASGSYVIKVHVNSSTGSYSVVKRSVLRVIASQLTEMVTKSVQLTFAANFGLISGKQEYFAATLENHFYKISHTDQVIFSNFNFKQGSSHGWAAFRIVASVLSFVERSGSGVELRTLD